MTPEEMKSRLKKFALRVVHMVASFRRGLAADVVGRQLIKSATSVAANYRASCRAKSKADFISKLGTVEEEADESAFWIDFAADAGLVKRQMVEKLLAEAMEITAIIVSSRKTARRNLKAA